MMWFGGGSGGGGGGGVSQQEDAQQLWAPDDVSHNAQCTTRSFTDAQQLQEREDRRDRGQGEGARGTRRDRGRDRGQGQGAHPSSKSNPSRSANLCPKDTQSFSTSTGNPARVR